MQTTKDLAPFLAQVIEDRRKARKMSMLTLAAVAGVDRTYIGKLSRNMRVPTVDTADRIARALDVPLSLLIKRAERLRDEK